MKPYGKPKAQARRVAVVADPGVNHGYPSIRGVPVMNITGRILGGEDPMQVGVDYGLSRAEMLTACWHTARFGLRADRRHWADWLNGVEEAMWSGRGYEAMPFPPANPRFIARREARRQG